MDIFLIHVDKPFNINGMFYYQKIHFPYHTKEIQCQEDTNPSSSGFSAVKNTSAS